MEATTRRSTSTTNITDEVRKGSTINFGGKVAAIVSSLTVVGVIVFHGTSPTVTCEIYRLAAGVDSRAMASLVSGLRTTITRAPWRFPPLGAKRAFSKISARTSSGSPASRAGLSGFSNEVTLWQVCGAIHARL